MAQAAPGSQEQTGSAAAFRKTYADLGYSVAFQLRDRPGQALPLDLVTDYRGAANLPEHEVGQALLRLFFTQG